MRRLRFSAAFERIQGELLAHLPLSLAAAHHYNRGDASRLGRSCRQ